MRGGIWVLAISAVVWCAFAIGFGHLPIWWILLPLALSGLLLLWASRQPGAAETGARAHIDALVGRWSAIEGVAIGVAVVLLSIVHRTDAILPAVAVIVGLHFLPLARGFPERLYYGTGAGLVLLGVAGLAWPAETRPLVIGFGAALIVWISAILLVRGRAA